MPVFAGGLSEDIFLLSARDIVTQILNFG